MFSNTDRAVKILTLIKLKVEVGLREHYIDGVALPLLLNVTVYHSITVKFIMVDDKANYNLYNSVALPLWCSLQLGG